MIAATDSTALERLASLRNSETMPVLFLGHGSPMNAIDDNEYRRSWQALGAQFASTRPRPQLVLCISAHWLTDGWWLTGMDQPRTIHDFGGFPQELFDEQYPAPGDAAAAQVIARMVRQRGSAPLGLDLTQWGLDHGAWSVLKPMFPEADIPVIQLSMDYGRAPDEHYALARQLKTLRNRGVLILGSGNIVHYLQQGNLDALPNFQKLGQLAKMAHPTHEHYLPLLYAAGAVDAREPLRFFNTSFQAGSISMRSVIWG